MSRHVKRGVLFAGLMLAWSLPVLAGMPNVNPGLWETTVKMQMQGMPFTIPPFTSRHCITQKDLVPDTQRPQQHCKVSHKNISGNTVSWKVNCDNGGGRTTSGDGVITYSGDSFQGTMNMQMAGGGGPAMSMHDTISGHRVGDCQ